MALLLDDLHRVRDPVSLSIVAFLAEHVPPSARLVIASRDSSLLPLARMRVQGRVLELHAPDLALGRPEVDGVLQAAGMAVNDGLLDDVVELTEGWPAAVSLAAMSLTAAADGRVRVADLVAGDHRDIVDYLSGELISRQSPGRLSFLLRTSVLDRLSAPLCDAVLDRDDSASVMTGLENENLFLLPLDRSREWYRYHHLFRDVLRAELGRHDPGAAGTLHRRAAQWHDRHGTPEEAVRHATAAQDVDLATEIVLRHMRGLFNSGRHATARRWLDAFSDEDVTRSAPLALAGALLTGLLGEREQSRRYMSLAEGAPWRGVGALGETSLESALALIQAFLGWDGVSVMRAQALTAYRLEPAASPAHEPAAYAMGVSLLLMGRTADAVTYLEEAAALGPARASVTLFALGALAQIDLDEGRPGEAAERARVGLDMARRLGLDEQTASVPLHAVVAQLAARGGDADARAHLDAALPLLGRVGAFLWLSIQMRSIIGRVAIAIGDLELAGSVLAQARRELARFPDAGILPRLLAREEHSLEEARGGRGVIAEPLTAAERRVLEVLPTHLSVDAIAELLNVSANTVKSHQRAIYRKLGVARRSDAVAAARRHGLLGDAA